MILGVIPARGGSKGVPRKNLRPVGGKPLLAWAIDCARASSSLDNLVVSTDDKEIAEVATKHGCPPPFLRPAHLATDQSAMLPVLEHAVLQVEALHQKQVEFVVLLDPTAPLRIPSDIDKVVEILRSGDCNAVVSGSSAHRSPWFNMVKEEGPYVDLVIKQSPLPTRRQDCPKAFDLNTIAWGFTRKTIIETKERIPPRTKLYLVPPNRSIDLDTEFDFAMLDLLLKERLHEQHR